MQGLKLSAQPNFESKTRLQELTLQGRNLRLTLPRISTVKFDFKCPYPKGLRILTVSYYRNLHFKMQWTAIRTHCLQWQRRLAFL